MASSLDYAEYVMDQLSVSCHCWRQSRSSRRKEGSAAVLYESTNIEKGAETLKSLADIIDTDKMKAPSFLMVLIGVGQYAYRRPDGVYVVPIGSLKD